MNIIIFAINVFICLLWTQFAVGIIDTVVSLFRIDPELSLEDYRYARQLRREQGFFSFVRMKDILLLKDLRTYPLFWLQGTTGFDEEVRKDIQARDRVS